MANLVTLGRLLLLIVVVVLAYQPYSWWHIFNVGLLIFVFASDGIDGYVARKRNEASVFGAVFDIAGDRITELSLWIVTADLGLVPIWVPIVFVIRGSIVDAIRAAQVSTLHDSPFSMMQSSLGKWLVAGRFMRIFYAAVKGTAFCWLLLIAPLVELTPGLWASWGWLLQLIAMSLVYLSVVLCILRGLPVIVEFVYVEKDSLMPRFPHGKNN
jgi:CDP-diacylglycerol--glycerol-3-phosphate 3-phosphatidyltransferase